MRNNDKCFSWTPEKRRLLIQLLTAMLISLAGIVISTIWLACTKMPSSKYQMFDTYVLLFFIILDVLSCAKLAFMLRQVCKWHRHMEKQQTGLEGLSGLLLLTLQGEAHDYRDFVAAGAMQCTVCDYVLSGHISVSVGNR